MKCSCPHLQSTNIYHDNTNQPDFVHRPSHNNRSCFWIPAQYDFYFPLLTRVHNFGSTVGNVLLEPPPTHDLLSPFFSYTYVPAFPDEIFVTRNFLHSIAAATSLHFLTSHYNNIVIIACLSLSCSYFFVSQQFCVCIDNLFFALYIRFDRVEYLVRQRIIPVSTQVLYFQWLTFYTIFNLLHCVKRLNIYYSFIKPL